MKKSNFKQALERYWQKPIEHLRTIRDRLLINARCSKNLLLLYQHILQQETIPATNCHEHLELRLSGLVIKDKGNLVAYNRL